MCYGVDRLVLSIEIKSKYIPTYWYPLSFIQDLLYKDEVNGDSGERDNLTELNELNTFLKQDYKRITHLLNEENNNKTHETIERKCRESSMKRSRQATKERRAAVRAAWLMKFKKIFGRA